MRIKKVLNNMNRYLMEVDFKVTITNQSIHIMNYLEIEKFSTNQVIIKYDKGKCILNGSNLVVSKMLDDELLITGNLTSIEYK